MALQPRLELRQSQSLVMTPQLQQAIKLLQLSSLDLGAFVELELERNPLLERDESREGAADAAPAEDRRDADTLVVDAADGGDVCLDIELDNTFDEGGPADGPAYGADAPMLGESLFPGAGGRSDFAVDDRALDETLAASPGTLRDHLIGQLDLNCPNGEDRMVGRALIDALDDNGWLTVDLDELAQSLGADREHVDVMLDHMRGYDPTGVFATSLRDCLALQLAEKNRLDPVMEIFLDNLALVASRDMAGLMKICNADAEDIAGMVADVRALEPRPAQLFEKGAAAPVIPDVLMRRAVGGGWIVELNPDALPRVLVNATYYARVNKAVTDKEEKAFLTDRFQSANWLVKSLDQRANTILKVATEIVRQQHRFFDHGVSELRPLILRDIAQAIDMHESTVSRVTSNKYIVTPRGVFELKYFFTQAINAADGGDAHSAEAVRHKIKALIAAESPKKILSDDALTRLLQTEGVDIARRTVAKYRETMNIPSSVRRRREKTLLTIP